MLKQDVLEIVHSKVRDYATHQLKKVGFRQNPDVCRNEDLRSAVNELQYVNDYTETRRPQSEVFGENYGKTYPTFTITDMKEYKFWPFVAGKEWDDCTSLRVTPGSLLYSLLDTFEELEKNGKVLRFATDRFEDVSMNTTRRCLKNSDSGSEFPDSGRSTMDASKNIGREGLQKTKISFIYFGISLGHLKDILQDVGFADITTEDIAKQNRRVLSAKPPPSLPRPVSLGKLVNGKELPFALSALQLNRPLVDLDKRQQSPQIRNASLRKSSMPPPFAVAQLYWMTERDKNEGQKRREGQTLLNPLNRKVLIQKRHDQRERDKQAFYLSMDVRRAIEASTNAYEKWWLFQAHLAPIIATDRVTDLNKIPCFGNSQIDGNLSSVESRPRRRSLACQARKTRTQRRPLVVEDIKAVDIWQCDCDVCSGQLLDYLRLHPSFLRNDEEFYAALLEEQSQQDSEETMGEQSKKDIEEQEEEKCVKTVHIAPETQKKRAKAAVPVGRRGRKGRKKRKKKKKKIDPKVWWQTVSTYTTPMWRPLIEPNQGNEEDRPSQRKLRGSLGNKLNISYSFEKLTRRKTKENLEESGSSDAIQARRQSIAEDVAEISSNEQEDCEEEDELNIEPLIAHNIIYVHKPPKHKSYTKLKLPSIPRIGSSIRKHSSDDPTTCGSNAKPDLANHQRTNSEATESEASLRERENCSSNGNLHSEIACGKLHFMHHVPDNFAELCLAGLAEYIIRFEAVTTRDKRYRRLESITINRTPLCCYKTRSG